MARSLVNPKLLQKQPALFPHRCTVQQIVNDVESDDEAAASPWTNVAESSGLPCAVGPASNATQETHFSEAIGSLFEIALTDVYAAQEGNQAVVTFYENGVATATVVTYTIIAVQVDTAQLSTVLVCRKLT